MIVLKKADTVTRWPAHPPGLRGCSVEVKTLSYKEARELAESSAFSGLVAEEEQEAAISGFVQKYIVAINGLAVEGEAGPVALTPANLVAMAPLYVVQALMFQVLRGSSLDGQQALDSRPPPSGGGTENGGSAPPVIDVPGG